MSRQLRFYLTPSDIELILSSLKSRYGLKILQEFSQTPRPFELDSALRRKSAWLKGENAVSARCFLEYPSTNKLQMNYNPKQHNWHVDLSSEVIELSGCDYDGCILLPGRFYFQTDFLVDDNIWLKRKDFLEWANKIFARTRKMLSRSKSLDIYIGDGAAKFQKGGGKFASSISLDGKPNVEDI